MNSRRTLNGYSIVTVLASNDHTSTGWQFPPLAGLMLKLFNLLAFLFSLKLLAPCPNTPVMGLYMHSRRTLNGYSIVTVLIRYLKIRRVYKRYEGLFYCHSVVGRKY